MLLLSGHLSPTVLYGAPCLHRKDPQVVPILTHAQQKLARQWEHLMWLHPLVHLTGTKQLGQSLRWLDWAGSIRISRVGTSNDHLAIFLPEDGGEVAIIRTAIISDTTVISNTKPAGVLYLRTPEPSAT